MSGFPKRPPRLKEMHANVVPFYFLTTTTYQRKPILAHSTIHEAFKMFCMAAVSRGVGVGRYVILPDHIHLFVLTQPGGIRLDRWVQSLKSVLGKNLLRLGIPKPHWQEGFFDHLLRNGESYSAKWEYVEQNPVRAGLCSVSEEWHYQGEIVPIGMT